MSTMTMALVGGGVLLFIIILTISLKGFSKKSSSQSVNTSDPLKVKALRIIENKSGIKIEVLKEGDGQQVSHRKTVSVHYTGWLTNGSKFDSSRARGVPFEFKLGSGQVIDGWDQGINGMKKGEKRRLTVPSHLGYGARGAGGSIPPNATLIFEVELVNFR